MLAWARGFGAVHRAGVECTGSYGAALSRHLHAEAVTVIEVNRADRGNRRRRGKTDTIDAEAAARAVLSGRATAIAKASDGHVQMLRMFKLAKACSSSPQPSTDPADTNYQSPGHIRPTLGHIPPNDRCPEPVARKSALVCHA